MSIFSARTLEFLWASVPVMCRSWNLQPPNLYERSASALRRTRSTASLHPLSHLQNPTLGLQCLRLVCPLRRCSTWGLILNLKRSALLGYRANIIRPMFIHDNYFKYFPVNRTVYCMGTKQFCCYQRYESGSNLQNFVKCTYENVTRELRIVS